MTDQTNPELELAYEYVHGTNSSIFLTGKAGSGKTTFLHKIKAEGRKRLVVVAPTGVAAINAGGMTIHSLFQLPFGLHLPNVRRHDDGGPRRFSRRKLNLIRSLDLLVIDEISMVRADMLDAVDEAMRGFRHNESPFGGVQVLMIGDLHQLPPVVKQEDWETLRRYYDTPYFFGSRALQKTNYVSIELKHIYRQSDAEFIALLNRVRDNFLDEETLQKINSRYVPNFRPSSTDAYITLTATNAVAFEINAKNLRQIPGRPSEFLARIDGDFPPSSYPTEEKLEFKEEAQVMFIKNDSQPEKRYFNGKIGRIVRLTNEAICVVCPGETEEIEVVPDEWKNVRFEINESTKEIEEQVMGTFTQYPLKLAWAITIHKSQGLTFERAIVDAQAAFAHGQVYVALSRCKSFEGIVLRSKIEYSSVKTDPVVKQFTELADRNAPTASQIQQAKREYQKALIEELFSMQVIQQCCNQLRRTYQEHQCVLTPEAFGEVTALAERARAELFDVADKFRPQLVTYLQQSELPDANAALQTRVRKAAGYFTEKIGGLLQEATTISTATDSQAVSKDATAQLKALRLALFVKSTTFAACHSDFSTHAYQRAKANAELDFAAKFAPTKSAEMSVPKGVPHPELYRQLLQFREEAAHRLGKTPRDVLPSPSLRPLVTSLPITTASIRLIPGIGKERLKQFGTEIGDIIRKYCEANRVHTDQAPWPIHSTTAPTTSKEPTKANTKEISFEMFRAGQTVEQIAAERRLAITTIQGHLAHFVILNQIDVLRLLDRDKLTDIEEYFASNSTSTAADAKTHFGNKYSYGELNLAISHILKQS